MSEPADGNGPAGEGPAGTRSTPKAVVHKQILDAAAADPDASMEGLAAEVSGASVDLVERVLERYGDPAEEATGPDAEQSAGSTGTSSAATTDGGTKSLQGTDATGGDDPDGDDAGATPLASDGPATDASADGTRDEAGEPEVDEKNDAAEADGDDPADATGDSDDATAVVESGDAVGAATDEPTGGSDPVRDPAALPDKQRETLRAVAADPTATQAEVADRLGVSRATVANRLRDLETFEWSEREQYVDRLFESVDVQAGNDEDTVGSDERTIAGTDDDPADGGADQATRGTDGRGKLSDRLDAVIDRLDDQDARIDALAESVDDLSERVDGEAATDDRAGPGSALDDPELVSKVVHACMDAEYVTEEEELRLLSGLLE